MLFLLYKVTTVCLCVCVRRRLTWSHCLSPCWYDDRKLLFITINNGHTYVCLHSNQLLKRDGIKLHNVQESGLTRLKYECERSAAGRTMEELTVCGRCCGFLSKKYFHKHKANCHSATPANQHTSWGFVDPKTRHSQWRCCLNLSGTRSDSYAALNCHWSPSESGCSWKRGWKGTRRPK